MDFKGNRIRFVCFDCIISHEGVFVNTSTGNSLGAEMLCGGVPEESRKASREAELRGTPSDGGAPPESIAATGGADKQYKCRMTPLRHFLRKFSEYKMPET